MPEALFRKALADAHTIIDKAKAATSPATRSRR